MNPALSPQQRQGLMLAAAFLRYPEKPMTALLADAGPDALGEAERIHKYLAVFARHMASAPLEVWQAEHVRVFDLATDTTPHLGWHLYGDTPDLGRAYAALMELYRDAGFEPEPGELPDTLPMVLEFLAVAPDWAQDVLLEGFAPALQKLTSRLSPADCCKTSVYAPVLCAVNELLGLDSAAESQNGSENASPIKECAL